MSEEVYIHKVTESEAPAPATSENKGGGCPITGVSNALPKEFDFAEFEENPSYQEYKKIKRVMSMITKFYQSGSDGKKANYDQMTQEIAKLDADMSMVQAQLDALDLKPTFNQHPKRKEYRRDLLEEKDGLVKQREKLEAKQKEFYELYEWSKGVVKVCEWLENNLDHYCLNKLPELPEKVRQTLGKKPIEEISHDQAKDFARGLDEIVYNLQESQDFFAASLDGRLNKYHNIEKEIIEAQLEALKKFPEDNPRRVYVEGELLNDLEYVESNMKENPETTIRREKMLKSHQEFFAVLQYNKDKLESMGITFDHSKKYDPKFDHYQDE